MSLSQALNQFAQNLGRYRMPLPFCLDRQIKHHQAPHAATVLIAFHDSPTYSGTCNLSILPSQYKPNCCAKSFNELGIVKPEPLNC